MNGFEELSERQNQIASQVKILPQGAFSLTESPLILSFDVHYTASYAYVAAVLSRWKNEVQGIYLAQLLPTVAYVSGYFCFREGPLLLKMLHFLQKNLAIQPNILLTDGHGVAHPRKLGIASWLGVQANLPAIGCAKAPLLKIAHQALAEQEGSILPIILDNELLGYVLRRKTGVKPVYVSAGHLIDQSTSLQLVLEAKGEYRIPDILRFADQAARSEGNPMQSFANVPIQYLDIPKN